MELDDSQVGIIVFSRMNSSRLPGKALMNVGGMPLLERVIKRAKLTEYMVVLATSNQKEDDALEDLAYKLNANCYRGSEHNVLQRAVEAAENYNFKAFARLCGDRPLFSVVEMKTAIDKWRLTEPDIVTNNYPSKCLRGMTTEIIKTKTLRKQLDSSFTTDQQEHLTTDFYKNPNQYQIISISNLYKIWSLHMGFAVDTLEDYKIISKFINQYPKLDAELSEIEPLNFIKSNVI